MGVPPMDVVLHIIDRTRSNLQEPNDLYFLEQKRGARADLIGIPINIAVYRDLGRDAHATVLKADTVVKRSV